MSGWNWTMRPTTGTSPARLWALRGATVYCQWCGYDTDHNGDWHRWRLVKGRRKR